MPSSIGQLVELKALSLATNKLFGPLPPDVGSCSSLRLLDLSDNHITVRSCACVA